MIGRAVSEPLQALRQIVHLLGHFLLADDLGGALQQTGVQVEDVARIGLAAGRTAQDQRHLAVSHGLLGQVVIDHERMAAGVPEILSDGRTGKRRVILQRSGIGGRGGHHDGVVHRTLGAEGLDDGSHGGAFLADGHIDTIDGLARQELGALVDDGIDGDGRLAGLAVADDQLTLAAADRNHRVDGLEAGLERLRDGFAEDDAGRLALQRHTHGLARHRAESVQGFADRVDHAAHQALAHRDAGDATHPADVHPLAHLVGGTEQDGSDVVLFEVHHDAFHAAVEFEEFPGFGPCEAVDARHAVTDGQHVADLLILERSIDPPQLFQQEVGDFARLDCILRHYTILLLEMTNWRRMASIWLRTLPSSR